jgi:hypothetical protein
VNGTLLKPEVRSATTSSEDQNTPAGQRGVLLTLDITEAPSSAAAEAAKEAAEAAVAKATEEVNAEALAAAEAELAAAEALLEAAEEAEEGTLALSLELRDPASGEYVPLTAFAVTKKAKELEAATLAYTLYPGALETAAVANHEVQGLALPGKWRVKVTHSAVGDWAYTVGASALR